MRLTPRLGIKVPQEGIDNLEDYLQFIGYNSDLIDNSLSSKASSVDINPVFATGIVFGDLVYLNSSGIYQLATTSTRLHDIGVAETNLNLVIYSGIFSLGNLTSAFSPGDSICVHLSYPGKITSVLNLFPIGKILSGNRFFKYFNSNIDYDFVHHNHTGNAGAQISYNHLSDTPSIPSALSSLSSDISHRTVTDIEKSAWNAMQPVSMKGNANGYASLDTNGKILADQLPASVMEYKGTWNANTNTPTLVNGTGNTGDVYRVSVSGSKNLGSGNISFRAQDQIQYSGSVWQKISNTDLVTSVAGKTGDITLDSGDISGIGSAATKNIGTTSGTVCAGDDPRLVGVIDVQTFISSGTWTKPAYGSLARIQVWSAGGSGARNSTYGGTGGGGGSYREITLPVSALSGTETVLIGQGGVSKVTNSHGSQGGNSSFGSHITTYGGGGGSMGDGSGSYTGGGGAGDREAGLSSTYSSSLTSARLGGGSCGANTDGSAKNDNCGGTGAGISGVSPNNNAGLAITGGGGGGSCGTASSTNGGTSLDGGNGGNGSTTIATAGTVPSGGGGGAKGTSGKGADGKIIITVW